MVGHELAPLGQAAPAVAAGVGGFWVWERPFGPASPPAAVFRPVARYDADGKKGGGDAVPFATVTNKAALASADCELF